jgi:YD repeat-containing protein
MADGLGSVSYNYDQLSRLTAETRTLDGMSFVLNYQYNLAGELSSISNQWGAQVGYRYDKVGRLSAVTGSGYSGVTSYASNLSYRAFWGHQGNELQRRQSADHRLRQPFTADDLERFQPAGLQLQLRLPQ